MAGNEGGKIGGLLLAAGGSSRFGSPKQLALFEGKSLLRRATETLVNSSCNPIVVVLGAETERSVSEIADLAANICVNDRWQSGMSSSVKAGLNELRNMEPNLAAVMITLCDQPYVTVDTINFFAVKFRQTSAEIVAAKYAGMLGVPALFSCRLFNDLLSLTGDKGARELIRIHGGDVDSIRVDEAAFDMDTPDDLALKDSIQLLYPRKK